MLKNVLTVLSGSVTGQLLALAALPLLSRIYHAESFGKFQFYLSCLNVLLMFSTFRYEMGLLSVTEGTAYGQLLRAILRILILVSGVFAVLVAVVWLLDFSFLSSTGALLWLLVPATFIGGVFQTLSYLPMRNRAYRLSARVKVAQSFVYVLSAVSLCWTPFANEALVVSDIVARAAGSLALLKGFPGTARVMTGRQTVTEFRSTAREFKRFPMLTFPGTLISALTATIMPVLFAHVFGFHVAGQYALVDRFVIAPVGVIAAASMQVFTGEFSASVRDQPEVLNVNYRRIVRNLFLIAVGPAVLGALLAPSLIPVVFGPEWVLAGKLCAIAMPVAVTSFVVVPVNMTIVLCGRQRIQFAWELFRAFVMMASLFPLLWFDDLSPETLMSIYSAAVVLSYCTFLVLADHATRHPDSRMAVKDA